MNTNVFSLISFTGKNYIKQTLAGCMSLFIVSAAFAQQSVKFTPKPAEKKIDITIGGKLFTSYIYIDSLDKPVLFPVLTPSGIAVTRGFPLAPRSGERTDHPHHFGIWFNYGDVNGLDFWNNSYAIKEADKPHYGSIHHQQIVSMKEGKKRGELVVTANWVDYKGNILLKELTRMVFSGDAGSRSVERTTTLTAQNTRVEFKDSKEGMFGIRVCRELEMPSNKAEIFTDASGIPTKVPVLNNEGVTGNYLTSEGRTGEDAWGTRAKWVLLHGTKAGRPVSISMFDYPANPGYPSYWHARGYGLFAANPLGQEIFSNGKEKLDFTLPPGASATFRFKLVVNEDNVPDAAALNKTAAQFEASR